jgi:hypothetical protein
MNHVMVHNASEVNSHRDYEGSPMDSSHDQ